MDLARAEKANLTPYDVVTIASMVEREAEVPQERPLVAAVIWNRLRKGMRLQIDATIQYALGKQKPVLTYNDLKIDSPYNTYTHSGLPPTPIANPGLASLRRPPTRRTSTTCTTWRATTAAAATTSRTATASSWWTRPRPPPPTVAVTPAAARRRVRNGGQRAPAAK